MTFSYDRIWQDAVAMGRANASVLVALLGLFVFLPALALFMLAPVPDGGAATGPNAFQPIVDWYRANLLWLVLANAFAAFGRAAILVLLLDRSRPTVAVALGIAAALFPAFFAVEILRNVAIGIGFVAFIVPGLYLLGRFAAAGPLVIDRKMTNPLRAIGESWRLTDGIGWRIAGLFLLIAVVSWVALTAAVSTIKVLGGLLLPEAARVLLGAVGDALSTTVLAAIFALLAAAIYRQIAPSTTN